MANYDATTTNNSKRSNKIYSDVNLDFDRNPATKDVVRLTDVEAVKRAVRNLVLTNRFERPFHPEIGCDLRALLFENMTPIIETLITDRIKRVLDVYEPRANIVEVTTNGDLDKNEYKVRIAFYVVGSPDLVTITEFLQRLR